MDVAARADEVEEAERPQRASAIQQKLQQKKKAAQEARMFSIDPEHKPPEHDVKEKKVQFRAVVLVKDPL